MQLIKCIKLTTTRYCAIPIYEFLPKLGKIKTSKHKETANHKTNDTHKEFQYDRLNVNIAQNTQSFMNLLKIIMQPMNDDENITTINNESGELSLRGCKRKKKY